MEPSTQSILLDLNRRFYQTFAPAFAATRRRIQPGVRAVLRRVPDGQRWLDIGCGSGALALEWSRCKTGGSYLGLDSSRELLAEAQQGLDALALPPFLRVRFKQADLSNPYWTDAVAGEVLDGALSFAVLHHLPGAALRLRALRQVRELLPPGGSFVHSEWQFQHSERLMARRQPWSLIGLSAEDVEPGDTLLDWRYTLPGQPEQVGLRYVHLFTREELDELAAATGFAVTETFESDGEGGRLGLYQWWQAQ